MNRYVIEKGLDMRKILDWIMGLLWLVRIEERKNELAEVKKKKLSKHDPNWLREGNNLQKSLDKVCIKHHGYLPDELRDLQIDPYGFVEECGDR